MKTTCQVLLMLTLSCGLAFGQAAERATAATNGTTTTATHVAPTAPFTGPFFNAITATIKPPAGQSDLLVTLSAFTALVATSINADLTTAAVISSTTSEATAIQVRLLVDGNVVPFAQLLPVPVTIVPLDNLIKTTILSIAPPLNTDTLAQLFSLGGVRSVTWVVPDVGNGVHTVTVQARFLLSDIAVPASTGQSSSTLASLGPRTLTVEG